MLLAVAGRKITAEAQRTRRLGGWTVGLLMNFNVPVLKHGIGRVVLNYNDTSASSAPLRSNHRETRAATRRRARQAERGSKSGSWMLCCSRCRGREITAEAQRTRRRRGMRELTEQIIGAAIEVHTALGPGLLESTYEECVARELQLGGLGFERPDPAARRIQRREAGLRIPSRFSRRASHCP